MLIFFSQKFWLHSSGKFQNLRLSFPKARIMSIEGTFKLKSSDKFNEYMKAVGVGLITRKLAAAATPTTVISKLADGSYKIITSTTFKTVELKFKLGEPFKEETADGRKCTATITLEKPNLLKHVQRFGSGPELVITREFTDKEMKMVLNAPGVVCTRIYERI